MAPISPKPQAQDGMPIPTSLEEMESLKPSPVLRLHLDDLSHPGECSPSFISRALLLFSACQGYKTNTTVAPCLAGFSTLEFTPFLLSCLPSILTILTSFLIPQEECCSAVRARRQLLRQGVCSEDLLPSFPNRQARPKNNLAYLLFLWPSSFLIMKTVLLVLGIQPQL